MHPPVRVYMVVRRSFIYRLKGRVIIVIDKRLRANDRKAASDRLMDGFRKYSERDTRPG